MTSTIPSGSWAFVVLSIVHDGIYQTALYRLSHWLTVGKNLKDATSLARYVYGLHQSLDALLALPLQSASPSITYPLYDVRKNTALAAMRFQPALNILASVGKQQQPASMLDKSTQETLKKLIQNSVIWAKLSVDAVLRVLPEMHARQDRDRDVFQDFVDQLSTRSSSKDDRESTRHNKPKRNKNKKSADKE